jgi:hypothetical protein
MLNENYGLNNVLQVIDCQYFGCVSYYTGLFQYSNNEIEQFDNYQKMSFRNRCTIVGSNGLVDLSIPVVGGRNKKQLMRDVKIDYSQAWQRQHIKTINSCYGKAPFYEYYINDIEKLIKCQSVFLFDFNWKIMLWLKKIIQITTDINFTKTFVANYVEEFIIDNRNKWVPKNYQLIDGVIKYQQVFEDKIGFQKNVSIIDLLFCEGPNAKHLLKSNVA